MDEKLNHQDFSAAGAGRSNPQRAVRDDDPFFFTLSQISPVGIFRTDIHGNCLYVNERWTKITGMKQGEAIASGWTRAVHPDDRERVAQAWYTSKHAQLNFVLEYRVKRPDGDLRWVLGQATAEKNSAGVLMGYIGTITDITQIKQSEEELRNNEERLRQSEEKLRAYLGNISDVIWLINLNLDVGYVSPSVTRMLGMLPEDLIGRPSSMVIHPDDMHVVINAQGYVMEHPGEPHTVQYRVSHKDGRWIHVESTGVNMLDSPVINGVLVTMRDISDRTLADEALRASENRYRLLVESSPLCIHEIDLEGRLQSMNRAGLDMLGLDDAKKICGISCLDIVKHQDAGQVSALLRDAITNGTPSHFEFAVAGEVARYFKSCFIPIKDASGKVLKLMGITEDISERKNIEDELKQTKDRYDYATAIGKVGTWDWNPVTNDLIWSDETYRLMGLTPGSVTPSYELFLSRVHPDDRERINNTVQAALRDKAPYSLDYRISSGSGDELIRHATGKVEFDANDQPVRMLGTIQDITERKKVEEALAESRARQSAILNNSPYQAWLKDAEGRYLKVNMAYAAYARLRDTKQAIGKTDFDIWPKELAEKYRADDAEVIATRRQKHVEEQALDGDRMHWVETFKTPIIDENDHVLGTTGFARDITERKLAEEALRRSEKKFRTLFDSTSDMVLMMDETGFIDANRAALAGSGCASVEEFCKKRPGDFSPPQQPCGTNSLELAKRHIATAMEKGSHRFEWMCKRLDSGETFPGELSLTAMDVDGKRFLQVVVRDITERKQIEQQIHNLAFYDVLTQLPNRRMLNDRLNQAMASSKRSGRYGALLFLDLDNFKSLNDTYGHAVGDLLLKEVAHRIGSCVREMDTVARFGGDEFVVMLTELDAGKTESLKQAGIVAEKIRIALAEPYLLKVQQAGNAEEGVKHHCTSSMGAVLFIGHEDSPEELLKWADNAMYQAKDAGRNTIRFYDTGGFRSQ